MLERNRISVMYVASALVEIHTLGIIGEFILERNLTNITIGTNILVHSHA